MHNAKGKNPQNSLSKHRKLNSLGKYQIVIYLARATCVGMPFEAGETKVKLKFLRFEETKCVETHSTIS